jgi:putative transposase
MGRAIATTRRDVSASDLRAAAVHSGGGRVACRLLAIARLLAGASRQEAAESRGMERQTLRDLVHRYNERCLDLRAVRPGPHRIHRSAGLGMCQQ